MTTGSFTRDSQQGGTWYYNGSPQGSSLAGSIWTKTWTGGDSSIPKKPSLGPKVKYTTIRNGKVVTGSFRRRPLKRAAKRAPMAYSMTSVRRYNPRGIAQMRNPAGALTATYSNCGFETVFGSAQHIPDPPAFDANDQIKLVGKLREKMRGSDFNMSVFLGEGHQTLKLISESAIRLAAAYKAFKRGDVVSAANYLAKIDGSRKSPRSRLARGAASSWLELQYGWLPLLKDMKSGAEQLSHQLHVPFVSRQVVRIRKERTAAEISAKNLAYTFGDAYSIRSRQLIAYISEKESPPVVAGLLDPELVLWELTPFSFVADWLLPIGNYLEARAFASRLTGTFITTDLVRIHYSGFVGKTTATGTWTSGHGYSRDTASMTRSVSSSLAVPMPVVKPLAKAASWQHCANAIALLTSAVKLR